MLVVGVVGRAVAFIVCEGADQSVQEQTQVIICILKHMNRHFNVCRISSEYSTYCTPYSTPLLYVAAISSNSDQMV